MSAESEKALEALALESLTFDQLVAAANLAAKTVQERSTPDGRVEYFAANHLGMPRASIYKGADGKYCIYFQPSFGCVVAGSFDTVEEAKDRLINEVFIPNGYRVM